VPFSATTPSWLRRKRRLAFKIEAAAVREGRQHVAASSVAAMGSQNVGRGLQTLGELTGEGVRVGMKTGNDAGKCHVDDSLEITGELYEGWPGNKKGFFSETVYLRRRSDYHP
jgi:hypothetical protein